MPHLTPMNWILAMLTIWCMISMMNSLYWWNSPMKLLTKYKLQSKPHNNWMWKYTSWPN